MFETVGNLRALIRGRFNKQKPTQPNNQINLHPTGIGGPHECSRAQHGAQKRSSGGSDLRHGVRAAAATLSACGGADDISLQVVVC